MGMLDKMFAKGDQAYDLLLRMDGFENLVTGLGTRARDKAISSEFLRVDRPTDQWFSDVYHGNFLARLITEAVVEEAMGTKINLKRKTSDGEEPATQEELDQLNAAIERFDAREKFVEAAVWGRLYGRGALYPVLTGGTQDTPVDLVWLI